MKAGYLQFKPEFGKPKVNTKKIRDMISGYEFDLLVIPELSNSGYLFSSMDELDASSESPDKGKFCEMLKAVSREKNAYIVAGFNEGTYSDGKKIFFNSSILVYPTGEFRIYRKTHLFYDEKLYFHPGNSGFWTYDIYGKNFGSIKIGMMICFDWIFPEAARTLALRGAQIICHPSNLVMPYCQKAMFTRAIENHVFTITANRIETETGGGIELTFTGESVIVNPKGEYLATGSTDKEEITFVDIDPNDANNKFVNDKNNIIEERREWCYYKK
jgi:predicted amidohydrolase